MKPKVQQDANRVEIKHFVNIPTDLDLGNP